MLIFDNFNQKNPYKKLTLVHFIQKKSICEIKEVLKNRLLGPRAAVGYV
jgi:hypothetical protein